MKRSFLRILAVVVLALVANVSTAQTFTYPVKGAKGFSLTSKSLDKVDINYSISEFSFESVTYKGETMQNITLTTGISLPNDAGLPNLPAESRYIAIPQGAKAHLNIISCDKEVIKDVNIAPALRNTATVEEPCTDYVKDAKVYSCNANYPETPFEISEPTSLRGVDAVVVSITPFQYNPVTKELTVYSNVKVSVEFEGGNRHFGDDRLRSPYWDPILASQLMNYDQLPVIDYEKRMQDWIRNNREGAEYLIITPNNDDWAPYAEQLKEYRQKQGIITEVYRLDEMPATSTNEMRTWFHNAYNNWEIAPVAVCLLGDHGTNMSQYIPAETVSHPYEGSCITDNRYADPTGDNLPDMTFSRLVAQNASELPVFISKQIEYEYSNPNMDESFYQRPVTALGWQTERWFQLCSEVVGGYFRLHDYDVNRINCIYQGTPGSSWSSAQNTNQVTNYFGPNGMGYIPATPSELGNWNNGNPQMVVDAVNEGTFWVQHRDHGLEEGWGEPAVRNNHIEQMNNVGKLPFVMSINCLTGKFNNNTPCFAEAWMRRTYNGENAGAVGVLCPTEVSYSFVNDAFVWGVYDLFDGDFMPDYGPYAANTGNWMPAFGNVAGKYFLYQCSWPYNTGDKDITYTMFTAHCDAFLRIYTQVPREMDVTHDEVVIAGLGTMNVTAPEGTMISLVVENPEGGWDILAVAEGTGEPRTIEFEAQVPPTEINLVITGQDYLRYEDVIMVVPSDGPYIVYNEKVIHDANGNGQLDFGETVSLDITLKNVGSETMDAFDAVLETMSEFITIENGTASFGSIPADGTLTVENAYTFTVADFVPDNTNNLFTITVNNGDDTYRSNIAMRAYAPNIDIKGMRINETQGNGNGRLDAGEDAQLIFTFANDGHSNAANLTAMIQMMSPYITVDETTVEFEVINAGETYEATYDIHVAENTPVGYSAALIFDVHSGIYGDTDDYTVKVGLIIEDFESGELGEGWTNDNSKPWTFVTEEPYEGTYCLRSGAIGNNGTTTLILEHEAGSSDTISFYYKVSSEANYDKLHFYIDNIEKGNWSGSTGWTKAEYPVNAGSHTYKWTYTKDSSVASGSDCGWIDFVSLPSARTMAATAGPDIDICEGNVAQINGYAIYYNTIEWATAGDGTFIDANTATPTYNPGTQDIENGSVVLTMTVTGDGVITDELTVTIHDNIEISNALPDENYCALARPQDIGIIIDGEYLDITWSTEGYGQFEDAHAAMTTYRPHIDELGGEYFTMLHATVTTAGCGPIVFDYPFDMNPAPLVFAGPEHTFQICEGEDVEATCIALGFIEDMPILTVISGETYELYPDATTITLATSTLPAGTYEYYFESYDNGICSTEAVPSSLPFIVNISASPTFELGEVPEVICEGEELTIEMTFGGDYTNILNIEGMNSIIVNGESYTFTMNPTEDVNLNILNVTGANGCELLVNENINVRLEAFAELPVISGDNEPDVYVTPTTTYTIDNDVMVEFSLEPEIAGTLLPANDGKTVVVTWANDYKGNATLTAMPISTCNAGNATYAINVKNSANVSENNINVNIYPNPANDQVTISAEGMTHVTVISALGQVVIDNDVNDSNAVLDLSQCKSGSYMVRIITDNGVSVRHLNVVR